MKVALEVRFRRVPDDSDWENFNNSLLEYFSSIAASKSINKCDVALLLEFVDAVRVHDRHDNFVKDPNYNRKMADTVQMILDNLCPEQSAGYKTLAIE